MNLNRITVGAALTLALSAAQLATVLAGPASAADQNGQVENCAEGLVVMHSNGSSVWAASGDAKWQLIAIVGTYSGTYYDKKTGVLVPFGPQSFDKTYAKGNQTVDQVCTGSDSSTDPTTGAQSNLDFVASLRRVQ